MPRDKRQKASEVFSSTNWAFRSPGTFEQAFPNIDDCRIEVTFEGEGAIGSRNVRIFTKDNLGEYVDCRKPLCYNGGFNIADILRSAEAEKRTEIDQGVICQGYQGSPKGRRNYGPCLAYFKVKGTITYKADTPTT